MLVGQGENYVVIDFSTYIHIDTGKYVVKYGGLNNVDPSFEGSVDELKEYLKERYDEKRYNEIIEAIQNVFKDICP